MFLRTSGNSAETSLPKVMDMIVFWIASFLVRDQRGSNSPSSSFVPFVGILRATVKECQQISDDGFWIHTLSPP